MTPGPALIICNGVPPSRALACKLASEARLIVAADGGANTARRFGIRPHVIIGDLDSMSSSTRRYFRSLKPGMDLKELQGESRTREPRPKDRDNFSTLIIHIGRQDSTDLEKALRYCMKRSIDSAVIVGATGGRTDQTTGSLGCFRRFGRKIDIRMLDEFGEITLIRKSITFRTQRGERISLIPLGRCTGVSTKHLKYLLRDEILEPGVREGISNEATSTQVTVSVAKGMLLLYRFLK